MINPPTHARHTVPEAFNQYRQGTFERTVRLTEQAIARLTADGQTVTLASLCETTRTLDKQGKGLRPTSILRNPQAAELFHQHSLAYQARQQKTRKATRKRTQAKTTSDTAATYRGLRAPELIQMVNDLKTSVAELTLKQEKLKAERDAAYQLRDDALQQNTRLLAALTKRALPPKERQ